jgi:Methyltransferase FkbM domain
MYSKLQNLLLPRFSNPNSILDFIATIRPHSTEHKLIRIGGDDDGGYLIPDDLDGIEICYSPGVADRSDFESAMADRGIRSYLADYSVDGPAHDNSLFNFEKKYLGTENNDVYTTLESWVQRNSPDKSDFILQMDIEGHEYAVIDCTPRNILQKFRIMTIEFHGFDLLRKRKDFIKISTVFKRILLDFEVVHVHPNNASGMTTYRGINIPSVLEYTFLRKDRISSKFDTVVFPHKLDRPNLKHRPDIVLPQTWYT